MARYFFDFEDGKDEDGIVCETLDDLSVQAVDVLPDLIKEVLPDGSRRAMSVRVRNGQGAYVFRATVTLASSWIVETVDGLQQPGGDRLAAALLRAKAEVSALRRGFAEDGLSSQLDALDSLFSVAESEVDRLVAKGKRRAT